jgi:hypothetical protein
MASIMGNDRQVNSQVFSSVLRGINFIDMNFEVETTIYCFVFTLVYLIMTTGNNMMYTG